MSVNLNLCKAVTPAGPALGREFIARAPAPAGGIVTRRGSPAPRARVAGPGRIDHREAVCARRRSRMPRPATPQPSLARGSGSDDLS